jgi:hypothetical protein
MSQYEHTQRSPLRLLLMAVAGVMAGQAVIAQQEQPARIVLLCVAALFIFLAVCFAELTVRDDGERLVLRYGPLPLFGWTFFWNEVESAEAGRTSCIDGWGIHWIPGRGTTFNLWGFDCVVLRVKGKVVRIGTDDAEALAQFIRTKIPVTPSTEGEDLV